MPDLIRMTADGFLLSSVHGLIFDSLVMYNMTIILDSYCFYSDFDVRAVTKVTERR